MPSYTGTENWKFIGSQTVGENLVLKINALHLAGNPYFPSLYWQFTFVRFHVSVGVVPLHATYYASNPFGHGNGDILIAAQGHQVRMA